MLGILVVMPQADIGGGAGVMLLHFLEGARRARPDWRCELVFLKPGPLVDVVKHAGFSVRHVFDLRLRHPLRCVAAVSELTRLIRAGRIQRVFSWVAYGHLIGGLAAFRAGIPSVWYQIGAAKHWLDRLASLVPVRLVLAVSHYVAKAQDRIWPRRASTVVWPGIDIAECAGFAAVDRARLRSELRLPVDAPLAVIAGRLQYWKGMHTPIAAMPKVLAHFPKAHLCLVGAAHEAEPNYPQMLAKLASNLGVADHVTFAGRQDGVPRWMAAADVVVHASQEEPFGIVAIEAMACGRPVITGSDGGVCEAVRDGMEGIHVPFGDEAKLADALIRLFANPELASRLGTCGLQRAMQFTRERYAEEICSALEAAAR